jgi:hypothetical protein
MRKVGMMVLCCLMGASLYGQGDFRNGYIIALEGDTTHGLINYREGLKKYEVCSFKKSEEATVVDFTAGSIRGYRFIGDKFFASKPLKSDMDTFQRRFVEVLVAGKVSLYRHDKTYYVSKEDSTLYALTNEKKEATVKGVKVMLESNRHIGLLTHLMSDCEKVKNRIRYIRLTEKSLTEIVEAYDVCQGVAPVTYKAHLPYAKVVAQIAGGINFSSMKYYAPPSPALQGNFDGSVGPVGGISVDIISPRINQRISLHAGVLYLHRKYYSYNAVNVNRFYTERYYVTAHLRSLQIPLGIRYMFPERKFAPFVNGGLLGNYHIQEKINFIHEAQIDNTVGTDEGEESLIGKSQVGLWAGLGIIKSISSSASVSLELRYTNIAGLAQGVGLTRDAAPTLSDFQIFLGLRTK